MITPREAWWGGGRWWGDILLRPGPRRDPGSVHFWQKKKVREKERGAGGKTRKQGGRQGEKKEERGRFGP